MAHQQKGSHRDPTSRAVWLMVEVVWRFRSSRQPTGFLLQLERPAALNQTSGQALSIEASFLTPLVFSSAPICIQNLSFPPQSSVLTLALALLTGTLVLQSSCLCYYLITDNSLRKHRLATITLKTLHNGPYQIAKTTFFNNYLSKY